jgi:dihydropteroate synthase
MPLFDGRRLPLDRALVMGILNVTEDSFYAASSVTGESEAVKRAVSMAAEGADIIDVGAESTRPGSRAADEKDEMDRLLPVISSIRRELPDMPLSADTRKASVAEAAVEAGADIINDVSGLGLSEESARMIDVAAKSGAAYVLTHTKGTPDVMQRSPWYDDLFAELFDFFKKKAEALEGSGVSRDSIIIDPGLGFGKRVSDNLAILANVGDFFELGFPVMIGASRKGFIGHAIGKTEAAGPDERLEGTLAISALCAVAGVNIVRVHDVAANRRAVDMAAEIARHAM